MIENIRSNASAAAYRLNSSAPTTTKPNAGEFEQQLTQALSDSLNKLGVTPGTVNISITNNGAAAKQILITWNGSGAAAVPAATTTTTAATTGTATPTQAGNPFAGRKNTTTVTAPDATTDADPSAPKPAYACTTPWCTWTGPQDKRDEIVGGGGRTTDSGAPQITPSKTPAKNQWGYTGPGASNPYFTTPSNPLRQGYVLGFENWFQQGVTVNGAKTGPVSANKLYYANEEGAAEALRLVQQHEPDAQLGQYDTTATTSPFSTAPMYYVQLRNGERINAGLVLAGYYNHGWGVTTASDEDLARSVRVA